MKYTNTSGTVLEMEPGTEKNQFTMEINAKSFSILSEGIYSNKIKAVIRELYTNALDSHNEAGVTKLVDVHLPTSQEPYFYVQDYGVGLDQDDIINVYTKFFASTKDKTNRYTGSLGVGAKVFYAYHTRSCTIETVKNNKKIIYNCFLEDGIPSYTKMGEFDTKECNGVKIQIPVANRDFFSFEVEARNVFKWCEKQPNFIGKELKVEKDKKIFEGNGWYYGESGCTLVMGNIGYPIEVGESGLEKYKNLINSNIIIEARLGQVEFNSSREGLSYTPKTVAFLQKKFGEIKEELVKQIEDKIVKAKNLFEASCAANTIHSSLPHHIRSVIDFNSITYNGSKLEFAKNVKINGVTLVKYEYCNWRSPKKKDYNPQLSYNNLQIVEVDIKRGQHQKAKEYCQDNKKDVYLVSFDTEANKDCRKEFLELIGCDESNIIKASSITHTVTTSTKSNSNRNSLSEIMIFTGDYRSSLSWKAVSKDIKDKGVYVIRKGYQFNDTFSNEYKASSFLSNYLDRLKNYDINTFDIYAIKSSDEKDFIKAGWVELKDHIKNLVIKNKEKVISNLSGVDTYKLTKNRNIIDIIKYISDFKDLYDRYEKVSNYGGNFYSKDNFLLKTLNIDLDKEVTDLRKERLKELNSVVNEIESIEKKYPLFSMHYLKDMKEELVYYYKGKKNEV